MTFPLRGWRRAHLCVVHKGLDAGNGVRGRGRLESNRNVWAGDLIIAAQAEQLEVLSLKVRRIIGHDEPREAIGKLVQGPLIIPFIDDS